MLCFEVWGSLQRYFGYTLFLRPKGHFNLLVCPVADILMSILFLLTIINTFQFVMHNSIMKYSAKDPQICKPMKIEGKIKGKIKGVV